MIITHLDCVVQSKLSCLLFSLVKDTLKYSLSLALFYYFVDIIHPKLPEIYLATDVKEHRVMNMDKELSFQTLLEETGWLLLNSFILKIWRPKPHGDSKASPCGRQSSTMRAIGRTFGYTKLDENWKEKTEIDIVVL